MSNYTAICEIYSSKPAPFFDDDAYKIDKIGSFIAKDFDINIGTLASTTNGSVTLPQNIQLSSPLKIGDIVNVSLVNFGFQSVNVVYGYPEINLDGEHIPELIDNRNQLQQAYVISSIDGDRIVLTDYNEFNHSQVTVGWIGSLYDADLLETLSLLTARDMRAFASRLYPYETSSGKIVRLPFRFNGYTSSGRVSFNSNFEETNVKPFDVIRQAFDSVHDGGNHKRIALTLGATVKEDGDGFYVLSYIRDVKLNTNYGRFSVRVKPSSGVKLTPQNNASATTVWVQPEDNGEDYLRAGLVIAKNTESGQTFSTLGGMTVSDYKNNGITSIPSTLIGYGQLLPDNPFQGVKKKKFGKKAPDKTLYKNKNDYESDKAEWKREKDNLKEENKALDEAKENFKKEVKAKLGDVLTPETVKELISDAFDGQDHNKGAIGSGDYVINDWYGVILENIRKQVTASMRAQFTPVILTLNESDIFGTNVEFSGDENIRLFFANRFGASINGETAAVTQVNYTKNGRKYTFQTIPQE